MAARIFPMNDLAHFKEELLHLLMYGFYSSGLNSGITADKRRFA